MFYFVVFALCYLFLVQFEIRLLIMIYRIRDAWPIETDACSAGRPTAQPQVALQGVIF